MADKTERAKEILTQMMGPEVVKLVGSPQTGFAPDLMPIIWSHAFEDLWARPGLNPRDRSLITCAMLIAQRAENELRLHIPAAVKNGVTEDEIAELIYHASGYCGFPAAVTAREIAAKALGG